MYFLLVQRHTMYQVGLMESDRHIQFFWNALESFSQVRACMLDCWTSIILLCITTGGVAQVYQVCVQPGAYSFWPPVQRGWERE